LLNRANWIADILQCTFVGWLKRQCPTFSKSKALRSLMLHWENSSGGVKLKYLKYSLRKDMKVLPYILRM
jgi:hypothetical protein